MSLEVSQLITEFITKLQQECPPLAKIKKLIRTPYLGELNFDDFVISHSVTIAL